MSELGGGTLRKRPLMVQLLWPCSSGHSTLTGPLGHGEFKGDRRATVDHGDMNR